MQMVSVLALNKLELKEMIQSEMAENPVLDEIEESVPLLDDVEVTTTAVRVKGTADGYGKVDEIVSALRKDKCFGEIKQPRTEKAREGNKVTFAFDFAYTCSGETAGGA